MNIWKYLPKSDRAKWLRRFFQIGVVFKGVDGVLETAGGALFLMVSQTKLTHWVFSLTRPELLEDPDDLIANALRHAFSHLSTGGKWFGGIYLLVHGAIKIILVVCLLRGKLWSFPTAIVALAVFIGYQVYRLSAHFSWMLLFLTILDIIIIMLIWHEYGYVKHRQKKRE
jgi:uncharacterized membrane protein